MTAANALDAKTANRRIQQVPSTTSRWCQQEPAPYLPVAPSREGPHLLLNPSVGGLRTNHGCSPLRRVSFARVRLMGRPHSVWAAREGLQATLVGRVGPHGGRRGKRSGPPSGAGANGTGSPEKRHGLPKKSPHRSTVGGFPTLVPVSTNHTILIIRSISSPSVIRETTGASERGAFFQCSTGRKSRIARNSLLCSLVGAS